MPAQPSPMLAFSRLPHLSPSSHALHHPRFWAQPVAQLYRVSPTIPPRVEDQLSKAAGKLAEALEVARFTPSSGVAIDLGEILLSCVPPLQDHLAL
jgi:hypothetical protein